MRRPLKVGQYKVPSSLVFTLLLCGITSVIAGNSIWETITLSIEVEEPLSIISYPHKFKLYPGEGVGFNVTVMNTAPIDYTVVLDFSLGDSTYQDKYADFSNETYTVIPGQQNLEVWFKIKAHAPPTKTSLTVAFLRIEEPPLPPYEMIDIIGCLFTGTSGAADNRIVFTVNNTGTVDVTIDKYKLGAFGTIRDITDVIISPAHQATVTCPNIGWTSRSTYDVYLIAASGKQFQFRVTAP